MYKDTYLRNDADLKPSLHSSGKCIPEAACQAPSLLPWTCWAKAGALHKPGILGKAAGYETSPASRRGGAAQWCLGDRTLSPTGSRWSSTIAGRGKAGEGWTEQYLLSHGTGLRTDCISGETSLTCGGSSCSCNESRLYLMLELWSRTLLGADNGPAQKIVSEGFFWEEESGWGQPVPSYI